MATELKVTQWETKDLAAGKTYYWRVDSRNDIGTTEGTVWSFSTTAGGVLFYTDFTTSPAEYAEKYGSLSGNTDIFKKGSKNDSMTFNGMVIGVGATSSRIVAMPGCLSEDGSKDYGPATDDDKGATANCIQFINVTTPAVQGPCVITYYLGNPSTSQQTVKLYTIAGGNETSQDLVLGAKKRIFKFTSTYTNAGEVRFRLESNGKKIDVNDIIIERYGNVVYLIPREDNDYLGYSKGQLKSIVCRSGATDRDYYLSQFVILTLLVEFYDGQGSSSKAREYIRTGELQNCISARLKEGAEQMDEEEEERQGIAFTDMLQAYEALKSDERGSRAKTTKEGFLHYILLFLEKQGLVEYVEQDEMVKTTKKLDNFMDWNLLNQNNYGRVLKILGVRSDE